MMRWLIGLLVLLGSLMSLPAQAGCLTLTIKNLTVTQTFAGGTAEYNPFDTSTYTQTVSFDVYGGSTSVACTYFLVLGAGGSGNANARTMALGGSTLSYNAYLPSGSTIFSDLGTATLSSIITGTFAALATNATNHHSFTWTITPQQIKAATTSRYSDSATLSLYTGVLNLVYLQVDTKTITFQSKVDSNVNLSLVDSGSAFNIGSNLKTIDFGSMTSGTVRTFDIVVRSNDGYKVSLQSANKQNMVYSDSAAYSDKVPYAFKVNGAVVDLSTGLPVSPVAVTGTTSSSGVAMPVVVTLGTRTGNETAGNYKDTVTVSVIAN